MRLTYAPVGAAAAKEFAMSAEAAGMAPRHTHFLPPRTLAWSLALHLFALAWLTGPQGAAVRAQLPRLPLLATLRLAPAPAAAPTTVPIAARPQSLASRAAIRRAPPSTAPQPPEPDTPSDDATETLATTHPPTGGAGPTAPALPPLAPTAAPAAEPASAETEELALESYGRSLANALAHRRPYPRLAALRGWQGEVRVRVQVARKGAIVAVQLLHSSGYGVLDADAVQLVQQAEPLPNPPQILQGREFRVVVPILYKLDRAA